MAINFEGVIKQGAGTMELGVDNPSTEGVSATISTIGTDTNGKPRVKVGVADIEWDAPLIDTNLQAIAYEYAP